MGTKLTETVIDQALTILGQLLQRLWFGFLDWLLLMWVRILLSYMVWPLSICLFSLPAWILINLLLVRG